MANASARKKKIAILGGGIGGLTAAYELISQPGGADRYDITIYQLGWRVGGKGASGRNADIGQRIEEHGLHVWSGFYENAFQLMRKCYPKLNRVPGRDPLATVFPDPGNPAVSPAFRPHSLVVIEEYVDGRWLQWPQPTPTNEDLPGDGSAMSLWELLKVGLAWFAKLAGELIELSAAREAPLVHEAASWFERATRHIAADLESFMGSAAKGDENSASGGADAANLFLAKVALLVDRLGDDPHEHAASQHLAIESLVSDLLDWLRKLVEPQLSDNDGVRRLFILVDIVGAIVRGVLRDGVLVRGTTAIDNEDFIAWLTKHGAHDVTIGSGLLRGYYDYCFAYEKGDPNRPLMAAGDGLLHLARLTMQIKGAVFFKMQAGMGDTVFTPLYLVLRGMGVKFAFFHEVKKLTLSADQQQVQTVELNIQATLTQAARDATHELNGHRYTGEYWPLVDVKNLPCWPSAPLYDQLTEGDELRNRRIDLECPWSDWAGAGMKTLTRGDDFDDVVLATSVAPLKYLTQELSNANAEWRTMVEGVQTTQTMGVQLWCGPNWQQLGWAGDGPLLTGYAQPIQTWGDFSQVLPRESWPKQPGSVSYLCGNLPDAERIPDFSDHQFPAREYERLKQITMQWLSDNAAQVWPKGSLPINPSSLDPKYLVDPSEAVGVRRFDAQWLRANIAPSERYVLTVPGDFRIRMKRGRTPFKNLFVAGDFTFTGILGSIESSVMSGMMASRAISGAPATIYGEVDL